jgi:hypothetical protein
MQPLVDKGVDRPRAGEALLPAAVTITRTSKDDFGSRQLEVSIDGEHVATLLFGDAIRRELPPGPHRLRIHNTLVWKTVDFTLAAQEQIFFEAVNKAGPGTYLMTLVVGIGPLYVDIKRMS